MTVDGINPNDECGESRFLVIWTSCPSATTVVWTGAPGVYPESVPTRQASAEQLRLMSVRACLILHTIRLSVVEFSRDTGLFV